MRPTDAQSIEVLVRPFQTDEGVLQRRSPRLEEVAEETAIITWGRRANLNVSAVPPEFPGVEFPENPDPEDPEPPPNSLTYNEIYRISDTVRVENPNDSAQYVIVKRTVTSWFLGQEDGIIRIFNFNNALEG